MLQNVGTVSKIIVCLTFILCDKINHVLLLSSTQSDEKFAAAILCRHKFKHGIDSFKCGLLTADLGVLSMGQQLKAEQLIQQTKIRLYQLRQL